MSSSAKYLEIKNCNRCKLNKNFTDAKIEDIKKVYKFYKSLRKKN